MNRVFAILVAGLGLLASPARAAVTFEYILAGGYPLAISHDGNVVAGNTAGVYEAFRWTQATGMVPLGRPSVPFVGGGGQPGISADGTRISSTILSSDSTFYCAGLWTLGSGWQQLHPPVPPGGGIVDRGLSSVWGLSDNGLAVVGLLWRTGAPAHAFTWTQAAGTVDLGSTLRASRPNGVDEDGSVVVGWDEHPQYGYRRPAAWVNGSLSVLGGYDAIGEARTVTNDGLVVGGHLRNLTNNMHEAVLWQWNGTAWGPTQILGVVPGQEPDQGKSIPYAISEDRQIVIGYTTFYGDPYYTTGFIWTEGTGMMDIEFWLVDQGVELDPFFDIQGCTAMTPDGTTIVGYGQDMQAPYTRRGFRIHQDRPVAGVEPLPGRFDVTLAASPNPARNGTTFAFELADRGRTSITIHDAAGRLVRRILDGELEPGVHEAAWDLRDTAGVRVPAGVYFTRLLAGDLRAQRKITVRD